MKKLIKSVLIWYSPEEMFRLVTDVDQYMHFLPWCNHSKVLDVQGSEMDAEVGIGMAGVKQIFVTHNTHIENREVRMKLVKGPFSNLDGTWSFDPVGDSSQRACKVTLTLEYGFSSATLAAVVGPVFDKIAATLVDAFVKRAEQIYGADAWFTLIACSALHPGRWCKSTCPCLKAALSKTRLRQFTQHLNGTPT